MKIVDANKADYVICCGTNADQDVEEMGLVEGHAYTIVSNVLLRLKHLINLENFYR